MREAAAVDRERRLRGDHVHEDRGPSVAKAVRRRETSSYPFTGASGGVERKIAGRTPMTDQAVKIVPGERMEVLADH